MTETTTHVIDRRRFLKISAAGAGATILALAGGTTWALHEPESLAIQSRCNPERSGLRILVAYASKCGSTGEIAEAVSKSLCGLPNSSLNVEVLPARQVKSLDACDAVILGSALRFEKPLDEMTNFARTFQAALQKRPTAFFSAGVYMRKPSEENRRKTLGFLQPLLQILPPLRSIALFGGKMDYSKLSPFWRLLVSQDKSGLMAEGDGRDWAAIAAWAAALPQAFA